MNSDYFSQKPVRTMLTVLLVVAILFLGARTVGAVKGWSSGEITSKPKIIVTGLGESFAVPTAATFNFTVTGDGASVKAAQDEATALINKALDMLKASGVEEKNIKTVAYNVNPRYEYQEIACIRYPCSPGKSVITGYETSQTIEIKIEDTTKAGDLLTSIGELGVQNISGLNFTVEDDEAVMRDARQKAIADAKDKAEILASDLGVRLVKIVDFQESGNYPMYYYERAALDSVDGKGGVANQAAPGAPTGENKVTSNVTITYEIR